jgi:hypothetical protein
VLTLCGEGASRTSTAALDRDLSYRLRLGRENQLRLALRTI